MAILRLVMDEQDGRLLAEIISEMGSPGFVEATCRAIRAFSDFELCSVVLHRSAAGPQLMFEDLASIGCRAGIENYIRYTYRANPMLRARGGSSGAFRAADFRLAADVIAPDLQDHLLPAPEEELGFRTAGWPRRMEELGLFFGAYGGIVELSLYRERCRRSAPRQILHSLEAMRLPLAAAFERHDALLGAGGRTAEGVLSCLSMREKEVARLLLTGCSSEAISLRLGITAHTVKDHRKSIFRKLQVGSLAELFAIVIGPVGPGC